MDSYYLLGERESQLLDFLHRFKVASVEHIRELIYSGIGKNHVYKRLKKLMQMGMIQKIPHLRGGRTVAVYSLTERSFRQLMANGDYAAKDASSF